MSGNGPNPRFRPPSPRQAQRTNAAIAAALGHDTRTDPSRSTYQAARAAYGAEPADPRAYPMPAPLNWLTSLTRDDLRNAPKGMRNWLVTMLKSAVADPMAALAPVPQAGLVAEMRMMKAARPARVQAAAQEMAAFDELKVADMIQHLKKLDPDRTKYPQVWRAADRSVRNASNKVVELNVPYKFTRTGPNH